MKNLVEPSPDCRICPRLAELRAQEAAVNPHFHNAPVPSFGELSAALLIVGLAPGRCGAGRTGRPFTGDGAGDILYPALLNSGAASGVYKREADDGLRLHNVRITNAVRCVPPENKPTGAEIKSCNDFLKNEIAQMPGLRAILALGKIAHESVMRTQGHAASAAKFAHGARHKLSGLVLFDTYHCSRYNISTKRLSAEMFDKVLREALASATGF